VAVDVTLPKWGVTMQEGTLARWHVAEGESVQEGQPLAEIVTDKIDAELEAPATGILAKQCVAAGEIAAVGSVVAIIEER
jgi:pyruvate/2-oxoglutarate dehydrogenase complex dihydrolipoamide acyltransferase (E2) component